MTRIKVDFVTDSYKIRELCIRERWYEGGTIQDYNEILNYVDAHRILDEDSLEAIAFDIYCHSKSKFNLSPSYTRDECISNIKHIILNDATTICLCDE